VQAGKGCWPRGGMPRPPPRPCPRLAAGCRCAAAPSPARGSLEPAGSVPAMSRSRENGGRGGARTSSASGAGGAAGRRHPERRCPSHRARAANPPPTGSPTRGAGAAGPAERARPGGAHRGFAGGELPAGQLAGDPPRQGGSQRRKRRLLSDAQLGAYRADATYLNELTEATCSDRHRGKLATRQFPEAVGPLPGAQHERPRRCDACGPSCRCRARAHGPAFLVPDGSRKPSGRNDLYPRLYYSTRGAGPSQGVK